MEDIDPNSDHFHRLVEQSKRAMQERDMEFEDLIEALEKSLEADPDTSIEDIEKAVRKGQRNENEAVNLLGRVLGSGNVEKVYSTYGDDPWRSVDVIGIYPGERVYFIQVKTNNFTQKQKRSYRRIAKMRFPLDHVRFEVWVRIDYEGWHLYHFNGELFEKYIELPLGEEGVEKLRLEMDYYEKRQ